MPRERRRTYRTGHLPTPGSDDLEQTQLTHHSVHLPGHLFPPSPVVAGQQTHGDVVMPAGPGASFVLIEAHVALLGLELGFNAPAGAAHIGQGFDDTP